MAASQWVQSMIFVSAPTFLSTVPLMAAKCGYGYWSLRFPAVSRTASGSSGKGLFEAQPVMVRREVVAVSLVEAESGFSPPCNALFRSRPNLHGRPARCCGVIIPMDHRQHAVRLEHAQGLFHQGYRLVVVQDVEEQGRIH